MIRLTDSGYQLEDLGSSNGTLLRGERLTGAALLKAGETVRIGGYALSVVKSPLISLWARAILAESAGTDSTRYRSATAS